MNPEIIQRAGIHLINDSLDVEHVRFLPANRTAARRFAHLRQAVLSMPSDDAGRWPAALVCFELVPTNQLTIALKSCPFTIGSYTYLEWTYEGQLHRRALCPVAIAFWQGTEAHFLDALCDWARKRGYSEWSNEDLLTNLFADQLAWSARHLANPVWFHISGIRHLTAVPQTYLLREATGLVPPTLLDPTRVEIEADVQSFIDDVDEATGDDKSDAIVQQAVSLLSKSSTLSDLENADKWIRALLQLKDKALSSGPITTLVLAWMIDLVESGTHAKVNIEIDTKRRYCRVLALPIFHALKECGSSLDGIQENDLRASYLSILASALTDKRGTAAALSSFAYFVFEAYTLPLALFDGDALVPLPGIRAQLITEFEIERAIAWADVGCEDMLMRSMLKAALAMGYSAPFRLRELLHVRQCNVARLASGCFEVEIVGFPGRNKLKTRAATRRVVIEDPIGIQHLEALIQLRGLQGWTSGDFLFGSPNKGGEIYRHHALRRSFLMLLKATTGDANMTFHGLRHAYASRRFQLLMGQPANSQANALTRLAECMGHVSSHTTLHHYIHSIERVIQAHLIHTQKLTLELNSTACANVLGMTAANVRKLVERQRTSLEDVFFSELSTLNGVDANGPIPTHDWMIPEAPAINSGYVEGINPLRVLELLIDLSHSNAHYLQIASRHRVGVELLKHLDVITSSLALRTLRSRHGAEAPPSPTNVTTALRYLGLNMTAAYNPKLQPMVECLPKFPVSGEAVTALNYWMEPRRNRYIGIHKTEGRRDFFQLLKSLGFSARKAELCVQPNADCEKTLLLSSALMSVFQQVFGITPHVVTCTSSHPKRPPAYLLYGEGGDSAAMSVSGLEAVLFALMVTQKLTGEKNA
jgi:integrase